MTAKHIICVHVPVNARSTSNLREHHMAKHRRMKTHRQAAHWALKAHRPLLPCVVTLTRIGRRRLDAHDNLPSSLKAVVDGIADWLGVRDDDPRIMWKYDQRIGQPGVEVAVQTAAEHHLAVTT